MSLSDEKIKELAEDCAGPFTQSEFVQLFARAIEQEVAAPLQCKIDNLMLEYCPDEMTEEQLETWGEHQVHEKEKANGSRWHV